MKKPIPKLSMIVPWALLLSLILMVYFSSCSKPNLGNIVKEHFKTINNDDVEKDLTFFTDDIVFEVNDDTKLSGKDQLRNLMERDAVIKVRLTMTDIEVEGNTVVVKEIEKNEVCRLLGIEELSGKSIYKFRGRLIEKVKIESIPEAEAKLLDEKYKPFAEWANKEHPQEFSKVERDLPSAEKARLHLSLLKEWRDKTYTESVSAEQELIKLENEANDAWVKRDVEAYARLLADDYLATGPDGNMMTKAQDLASLKSDENITTSMIADDFRVRVYGDAAVVTFRSTYKSQFKGKESTGQERFTDTWVKRGGRWQCVATHYSRIAQK
jgi:ketosteroid isomerase-like protein